MNLLVTGAGGFLGRFVVASAVREGHSVRAMIRPAAKAIPDAWSNHPHVEVVRCDLRSRVPVDELLHNIDCVVHLAASKDGDVYEQFGGTVIATENLLDAMRTTQISRIVLTSTFAVYEFLRVRSWSELNEDSPLAVNPLQRDEYCQAKLVQEELVRECARKQEWRCVILRPGVVYGPGNLWSGRLGRQLSDCLWMRIGAFAPLPLTYVENCADAVVKATEYDGPDRELIVNVVDNDTPRQREYVRELRVRSVPRPRIFPMPWTAMRMLARTAELTNQICFRGKAKLPSALIPDRVHTRSKPLRYSNERIVSKLGWSPRYTWREGLDRAMCGIDLSAIESEVTTPEPELRSRVKQSV